MKERLKTTSESNSDKNFSNNWDENILSDNFVHSDINKPVE